MRYYFIYILTNQSKTLYVGMTDDLKRRLHEHRKKVFDGFTAKYNVTQLVYYETNPYLSETIAREKQLKGWSRAKKVALVEKMNPNWDDLSNRWQKDGAPGEFNKQVQDAMRPSN